MTQPASREAARIFVAEDEFLVAVQLEEDLISAGWSVVGPFSTVQAATEASRRENFDLAILDVNLNGEMVHPLAEDLVKRGIKVMLLSGYEAPVLPEGLRTLPRVSKPYDADALVRRIETILGA